MKVVKAILMGIILCMGLIFYVENLAGILDYHPEDVVREQLFDKLMRFSLQDAVTDSREFYGFTETPKYQGLGYQRLEIFPSNDPQFEYAAHSSYYKVFFKGKTVKMVVKDAWVEFELGEELGIDIKSESKNSENAELVPIVDQNSLSVSNVFELVDLTYEVDTSLLTEVLTLKEPKEFEV